MEQQHTDRKARFLAAKAAREKAEKEKGGYGGSYTPTDFEYVVLNPDKCSVLRLVGETIEQRTKKSDPLLVERSLIKADDNSYITMIWHPDNNWPFRQLIRKLAKYKYEDKTKIYEHKGCPLLERYLTNGKENPNIYETGWAPKKYVLMNTIDRMDSWCVDNKHTKMLAWDMNETDGRKFYTNGITYGLYKEIFDVKCTTIGSHFEEVDFVIRRFSKNTRPTEDMYYQIMHDEEKRAIQNWSDKDKVDYFSFINKEEYLSDAELAYERYDLEDIPFVSQPTPIGIIMNKLGKFIKEVDKKYDMGLWESFVEWKEVETAEWNKTKAEATESSSTPVTKKVESSKQEVEESNEEELPTQVEKKAPVPTKVAKTKTKKQEFTEEELETFAGIAKLSDEQKSHISKVDIDDGTIEFVGLEADAECGTCGLDMPSEWDICPYCGTDFS